MKFCKINNVKFNVKNKKLKDGSNSIFIQFDTIHSKDISIYYDQKTFSFKKKDNSLLLDIINKNVDISNLKKQTKKEFLNDIANMLEINSENDFIFLTYEKKGWSLTYSLKHFDLAEQKIELEVI